LKIQVALFGVEETVSIADVNVTPELMVAVDLEVKAAAAAYGHRTNWRLGWAVAFHNEPNPDVRRLLLAVLRANEPGTAGVSFQIRRGEVIAQFIRFGGRGLAERFAVAPDFVPLAARVAEPVAAPAPPQAAAPVPPPAAPEATPQPEAAPVKATRGRKPKAAAASPEASAEGDADAASKPDQTKSGRSVLKLKAAGDFDGELRAEVETVRGGYVKWWK
jgi:hypothetical protein